MMSSYFGKYGLSRNSTYRSDYTRAKSLGSGHKPGTYDARSSRSFDRGSARTYIMPGRTTSSYDSSALERYKSRSSEDGKEITPLTPVKLTKQLTEPICDEIAEEEEPVKCSSENTDTNDTHETNADELTALEKIRQRRQELIEKKAEIAERKSCHLEKKANISTSHHSATPTGSQVTIKLDQNAAAPANAKTPVKLSVKIPNEKIAVCKEDMDITRQRNVTSLKEKSDRAKRLDSRMGIQPLKNTRAHTIDSGSLPDLAEPVKLPSKAIERLKRDYNISDIEVNALRSIIKKVDLFDSDMRDRWYDVLKTGSTSDTNMEVISAKILKDAEVDSLKQKLFLSRKELDTYISFTKKMEREKRQSISEKEELETKIQWHERRLKRFEEENKSLKTERATLMNQIYDLRGKSTKESAAKKVEAVPNINKQPEIEMSKQRLMYEADAFAQERTKLIKDRQRLDEEVRKVQIRCVSLLAQLQHSENTVRDLKNEKEQLKEKVSMLTKEANESRKQGIFSSTSGGVAGGSQDKAALVETIAKAEAEIKRYQEELKESELKYDNLQNDLRSIEETRIELDHENMALKDTVNVVQKAKEDADQRVKETDGKYRETLSELRAITLSSEDLEKQRASVQQELDIISEKFAELQHEAVEMESDQDAFKKFLERLSMELQEKLGEDHVSKDKDAESLQEQAEIIIKQVVAHITPSRKMQDDYEELKEERDELEQELKDMKYVLSQRMEVQNLKLSLPTQSCECSKEKDQLRRELDDSQKNIKALEDEVERLHEDKQQLLMSFLNLQASKTQRPANISHDNDESDADDLPSSIESEEETLPSSCKKTSDTKKSFIQKIHNTGEFDSLTSNDDLSYCNAAELRQHLQEVLKTKERFESERVELLDNLCKQVDLVKELKAEIDDLRSDCGSVKGSVGGSRPGSFIGKLDGSSSSSAPCLNCVNTNNEIRQYLSIIEELTEEKLRLENTMYDADTERQKLNDEVERLTEQSYELEKHINMTNEEKNSELEETRADYRFMKQSYENLKQQSAVLEDNLNKLREEKVEILDNLKKVQDERFGFIRSLTQISEQKQNIDLENEELRKEIEELKEKLKGRR